MSQYLLNMNSLRPYNSVPRVLLGADNILTGQRHCDSAVVKGSHHSDILLARLGCLLACCHLVPSQAHCGLAFPTISCRLLKLFSKPEPQLNALNGGLRDHCPVAALLSDGHDGSGGHSSLPQDKTHIQFLQEILVTLISSLSVASCDL